MQRILLVGATSAIAEACARQWAARGDRLFLVARDAGRLEALRADLSVRAPGAVLGVARLDINDAAAHDGVVSQAWDALDGIDIALLAHGTLPDQAACEADAALARREFDTNATATIALLTVLAQRLQSRRGATIAAISSVAGDRGRASNYLYGAAKAAVSAFLSGLRQRLTPAGVNVLTIKPGFVDTPMTRGFKKGALWAKPDAVARGILRAVDKRRGVAYLPFFWWGVMTIIKHIPEAVFRRVKL